MRAFDYVSAVVLSVAFSGAPLRAAEVGRAEIAVAADSVAVADDAADGGGEELCDVLGCGGCATCCDSEQACYGCCQPENLWGSIWSRTAFIDFLPRGLLWEVPLANQREPRLFGKFFQLHDEAVIDTAIGGEMGLVRLSPAQCWCEAVQLDLFAVTFTRFVGVDDLTAADYRVGVPLTYACGNWEAKAGYEHTSCHLGDEFIDATGAHPIGSSHDEIVVGLARCFGEDLRVYGQAGYAFRVSSSSRGRPMRFDWGVEWRPRYAGCLWLRPFMAFDMDLRADEGYQANTTVQVGFVLKDMENGRSTRIAAEYYNGNSPYGQFFQDKESWVALSIFYDW